jgi:hypothetical protein
MIARLRTVIRLMRETPRPALGEEFAPRQRVRHVARGWMGTVIARRMLDGIPGVEVLWDDVVVPDYAPGESVWYPTFAIEGVG